MHLSGFRETKLLLTALVLLLGTSTMSSMAQEVSTGEYLPLESGNQWTYLENGGQGTEQVLSGTVNVKGVETKAIESSSGEKQYFTNDVNGIRLHRTYEPDFEIEDMGNVPATITPTPPITFANPDATLGEQVQSSGTVDIELSGLGTIQLNYEATSIPEKFETITVPLGTFKTIKLKQTIRIYGTIEGEIDGQTFVEEIDDTDTDTSWIARHIGTVKSIETEDTSTTTSVLTDTNIPIADLSITKTHTPEEVIQWRNLTYTVIVNNSGPDDASNVVLTDTLPTSANFVSASSGCTELNGTVTCNKGDLSKVDSTTVTIVVTPTESGSITNTVSVDANEADPNDDDNTTDKITDVIPGPKTKISPGVILLLDDED